MIKVRNNGFVAGAAVGLAVAGGAAAWSATRAPGPVNAEPLAVAVSAPAGAPQSFATIFEKVSPAVVSIDITGRATPSEVAMLNGQDPDGGQGIPLPFNFGGQGQRRGGQGQGNAQPDGRDLPKIQASGSGFFISADGYIVTNNHVVEHADTISVKTADKQVLKATLVGRDPATDIAVIKVEGAAHPFVTFETSARPRVGDWVVAVGNPFGLGGTATAGIVSALGRENVADSRLIDYMQIDAPINRGNSGGPTFDVYGRVVGVNTAIYSPSGGSVGIGFDIPADVVASTARQLIADGKVSHGYIGATIQDMTPDMLASVGLKTVEGAIIAALTPNGPAAKAGIQLGDIVLAVDGKTIGNGSDLTRHIAFAHPGDNLRLTVLRDGKHVDLILKAGLRPSEEQLARAGGPAGEDEDQDAPAAAPTPHGPAVLGMRLGQLDEAVRSRFNLKAGAKGVVVESVGQDTDAAEKGLQPGDLILKAGAHAANAPADVASAVADAKRDGRSSVLLLVSRDGQTVFVPLGVEKALG